MCTHSYKHACMHEWQLFPVNLPTLPPLERAARGNNAMTQAPVPARASSGPKCLARHKVGPGVPPTLAVARVSKRRLLYVHERSQGVLRDVPIRRAGRPAFAGPSNMPRVVGAQAAAPRTCPAENQGHGPTKASRVPLGTITSSFNVVRSRAASSARVRGCAGARTGAHYWRPGCGPC